MGVVFISVGDGFDFLGVCIIHNKIGSGTEM